MKIQNLISVVDSHTEGQNTRVIIGGIPHLKGKTMFDKREDFNKRFDHIRTSLVNEPRGWAGMLAALITDPVSSDADFGVIFMDAGGCMSGCIHGSIGVATVAAEIGLIPKIEPQTIIKIDTESGCFTAYLEVDNGNVIQVTIENVPSFVYVKDENVDVPDLGKIKLDVSFGGNFYAIVSANQIGMELNPKNSSKLIETAKKILKSANEQINVVHPEKKDLNKIDFVEFTGTPILPEAKFKTTAICCSGDGAFDRSPCGTGTSAKTALEYAKGNISLGEQYVSEGLLGSTFTVKVNKTTRLGKYDAIIPEIGGRAFITGFKFVIIDQMDPFRFGF